MSTPIACATGPMLGEQRPQGCLVVGQRPVDQSLARGVQRGAVMFALADVQADERPVRT